LLKPRRVNLMLADSAAGHKPVNSILKCRENPLTPVPHLKEKL
jgi:hypothetical protein